MYMYNYAYMEKVCHFCGNVIQDKKVIEILETPIIEWGMSKRVNNALLRGGIDTVEKMMTKTPKELLRLRNLGKVCFREVIEKLEQMRFAGSTDRACSRQG